MFTLLLTMVAFQFTVNSTLPNVPYLTMLDEYLVMTLGYLFSIMVLMVVSNRLSETEEETEGDTDTTAADDSAANDETSIDTICWYVSIFLGVLCQVCYFFYAHCYVRKQEKKKLYRTTKELYEQWARDSKREGYYRTFGETWMLSSEPTLTNRYSLNEENEVDGARWPSIRDWDRGER